MATPKLWWYPDNDTESASLEELDLGEELSDLQFEPIQPVEQSIGIDGRVWTTVTGASRLSVRVALERFTDESVAWGVQSLQAHLALGYHCALARDPDKSWAGYLSADASRGDTTLITTGPVWLYDSTPVLAIGDWVCIEELGGEGRREYAQVGAIATTATTGLVLQDGIKHSYAADDVVLVRHVDFFPSMVWPVENRTSPIITHDRRLSWTLDVSLVTDPVGAQALYETAIEGGNTPLLDTTARYSGITLDPGIDIADVADHGIVS